VEFFNEPTIIVLSNNANLFELRSEDMPFYLLFAISRIEDRKGEGSAEELGRDWALTSRLEVNRKEMQEKARGSRSADGQSRSSRT
jgi:hypothetical protein